MENRKEFDFGPYQNRIDEYVKKLCHGSEKCFIQQRRMGQLGNNKVEADALLNSISNLLEFMHYNYRKEPKLFNDILKSIENKVQTIALLPVNSRGIYGRTVEDTKTIYINPSFWDSKFLTGEERAKLYMAHEVGHIINSGWMNKVENYANKQIQDKKISYEDAQLFYDGFSLLDEVTTQNRAENYIYDITNKKRPGLMNYYDVNKKLFNGEPYKTNFDYYGELQAPATMIAKTLDGVENNDSKALDEISKRAMSPSFYTNLMREKINKGEINLFVKQIKSMGLLKRAAYARFGQADQIYLTESKKNLDNFKRLTSNQRNIGDDSER